MVKFVIEKTIPFPNGDHRTGRTKYPFKEMAIGDSVFVDNFNATVAARAFGYNHDKVFMARIEGSGWRIWRKQ